MKLVSFSLKNYRSILKLEKIALGDMTILIGPNNEGKSNILSGLVTGMELLSAGRMSAASSLGSASAKSANLSRWLMLNMRSLGRPEKLYDWERDFPISLQDKNPAGTTTFNYEFKLSSNEIIKFKQSVHSTLNGSLPVCLTLGHDSAKFEVKKRGPGGASLTAKGSQIARFISEHLDLKDIPSIRTASSANRLIDTMVQRQLRAIENTPEYVEALEQIAEIQQPVLDTISSNIEEMLRTFLPDVKSVSLALEDRASALRRDTRIFVDDGTRTELKYKGDGMQSLAAISLIHNLSVKSSSNSELILAVEEPEAHLHPKAIHQLRAVLQDIARRQQVILTTHSPLLVNRSDIGSNVIVDKKRAKSARSVGEIRQSLGVRVSDSLSAAELVLLVEGETDRTAMLALAAYLSKPLASALREGLLAVDSLHGSANLLYRASNLRDQLCTVHAFLDHDAAGITAAKRAAAEGLLDPVDRTFAIAEGMRESELEDLYNPDLYRTMLQTEFGVSINSAMFRNRKKKWKERLAHSFQTSGQHWDDQVEKDVKIRVAQLVELDPGTALHAAFQGSIDSLVSALESKLGAM